MRTPGRLPVIPALFVLLAHPASATTLHVPGDYPTVGAALAVVAAGDTVRVHPGRYAEYGLVLPGGVTLLGETSAAEQTWFDGAFSGFPILTIPAGADPVTIRWLTFRSGSGATAGAIAATTAGTGRHVVSECSFRGNRTHAISAQGMQITGCTFLQNEGSSGSGVYGGDLQVESCVFRSNEASGDGAGIRIASGEVTACRFEDNVSGGRGGAVYNQNAVIRDCMFVSNAATSSTSTGGGLQCTGAQEISGCVFVDNHAGKDGGAVYLSGNPSTLTRCRFLENAAKRGGGVYASAATLTTEHCSFLRNSADEGGAVFAPSSTGRTLTLRTTVIQETPAGGALARAAGTATPTLESCDLFGNAGGDFTGDLANVFLLLGNFSADALFCDAPRESLLVASASPLLAANNDQGVDIGAVGVGCDATGIVVTSRPPGLSLEVDGVSVVSPAVFDWSPGASHTISAPLLFLPRDGQRSEFRSWSDGGAATHAIVAPLAPATFRAEFASSFLLAMGGDPCGTFEPEGGWRPAYVPITIRETGGGTCVPIGWTGTGIGSYTGPNPEAVLPMIAPVSEFARFQYSGSYMLTMVAQPGGSVLPASGLHPVGTVVSIQATPDAGWRFDGWTGHGIGSYTGPNVNADVTMNGPITEEAAFHYVGTIHAEIVAVGGGTVSPPSGDYLGLLPLNLSAMPAPGFAFDRWLGTGPGSYSGSSRDAVIFPAGDITETAYFAEGGVWPLTMTATPGGLVSPVSGNRAIGEAVNILATPISGHRFVEWQGEGLDSYSGPDAHATIAMHGAITEHAAFEPDSSIEHGYEFSLSASDVDPFMNFSAATGGPRTVHLWLTCSQLGIAAFECGVQSTLPLYGFAPAPGVYNFGNADDLLLAIADCPTGESVAQRLGSWTVLDTGGQICLGRSTADDLFAAVDCGAFPAQWVDPVARGFSSREPRPCITGLNGCRTSTSVEPGPLAVVVTDTGLSGVHPNPFRSTTEIRFSLATSGRARIALYDVMGRLVDTLRDGESPAGEHAVSWNGRAGERTVAAGIYFVRFEAGGVRQTERVVFLGGAR